MFDRGGKRCDSASGPDSREQGTAVMTDLPPNFAKHVTPETLSFVLIGLRILFIVLVVNVLRLIAKFRDETSLSHLAPPRRLYLAFFSGIILLFTGVLGYQATWQLSGFARPGFVNFMKTYNRRDNNPARFVTRGRILDRAGVELAVNIDRETGTARRYPRARAFCHLVGYSDPKYGQTGIEAAEDAYLSGRSLGSWPEATLFLSNVFERKRIRGNDLRLTLDAQLQELALELLEGRRGAVAGIRPADGAVVLLVSSPTFDPNVPGPQLKLDAGTAPMLNRPLQGLYPPGSVFKTVMAGLALEDGFALELDCPADGYTPSAHEKRIRDHEYYEYQREGKTWNGYGRIGLARAFARSSNVFFAQLGVHYGTERLSDYGGRWLFNRPITVLAGSSGSIRTVPSKLPRLDDSDLIGVARLAIGQGKLEVTPFHMALLGAAIAHDGIAFAPRIAARQPPAPLATIMPPEAARKLKALMRQVVDDGTARAAKINGLSVAGKTGTAENPHGDDHSWFLCFAPVDQPALALIVLVENGGYGAMTAVPIAKSILMKANDLGMLGGSIGSTDGQPDPKR